MEVNPLSIILVKSDSKGDRLLFRYPFQVKQKNDHSGSNRKNPYTLNVVEDLLQPPQSSSNINKENLIGFGDEVLSSLFAVKMELYNKKFELKVNDVRFVSHPTQLQLRNKLKDGSAHMLINIVFALQAVASQSVVKCYHDISQRMGIALRHEERRRGYVSDQTQLMTSTHDDGLQNSQEAFGIILETSSLAKNIKKMYEDLCGNGLIDIRINGWIPLSFCLPHKAHQSHLGGKIIEPEDINRCLNALRPYHSLLLLYPLTELNNFCTLDGSPTLKRLLSQYSPLKNLQTLALDCDLTLTHVFELTAHLVYWAKATVIFPICSTNKYVISPDPRLHRSSPLMDKFSEAFPGHDLLKVISDYSLPTSLGQKCNPLFHPSQQSHLVQTIIWMLQHHLLLQLHTYVQYMPLDNMMRPSKNGSSKHRTPNTPPPRGGNFVSSPYPEHSRAESESGTSTVSETPEPRSEIDVIPRNMLGDMSFTSNEEEKQDYQEELLLDFPDDERSSIFKIPATNNPEDIRLFAKLCRRNYFKGEHHIEEIMYLENLRRSQLLQLLDKFRDVLLTYETEDPAIAMFSCSS
ncbi:GATOR complex protein NPRL3 [Harmonia axyridis]|uniref:GATOR complex protein NPRL3 n=1 Tax=Harmonia axyridis TaxID=115357 RepID=UPI001E2777DA|nr:GATOR complex protein NPRL3 [Harmonia axyridis]